MPTVEHREKADRSLAPGTLRGSRKARTVNAVLAGIVPILLVCWNSIAAAAQADTSKTVTGAAGPVTEAVSAADTFAAAVDTGAVADTTTTAVDSVKMSPCVYRPVFHSSPLDSVSRHEYLLRRSYSLDNFLEHEPGYFLGRSGPIGNSVLLSRYAFGRGRCAVYLNDIPVNDPQNGVAPLVFLPVSGIGSLLKENGAGGVIPGDGGLEGRLRIVEVTPRPLEPVTFIGLSKDTRRNLRQRRLWFASMKGNIGLDFGYDEILNGGYFFDANRLGTVATVPDADYGQTHMRCLTVNLRGELPNRDSYVFSLRRFIADRAGDLDSFAAEQELSGHVASVSARLGGFDLNLFSRGYDAATRPGPYAAPDSNTVNLTTAAYVDWSCRHFSLGGGLENIRSFQDVGGARANNVLRKLSTRFSAVSDPVRGIRLRLRLGGVDYDNLTYGWSGMVSATGSFGGHEIGLDIGRRCRMPNLGELFLPAHTAGASGSMTVSGNANLGSEYGWEAGGRVTSRRGPVTNEVRLLALRIHDPIGFVPGAGESRNWLIAANGTRESAAVFEERLRLDTVVKNLELRVVGSIARTFGDNTAYFLGVPRWASHAGVRFGRGVFQSTSALYAGLDYTYTSSRRTWGGERISSYHVLNIRLDGRLLDADMYLTMMNVFDARYQTVAGYLMMPRTVVYGIAWNIFN